MKWNDQSLFPRRAPLTQGTYPDGDYRSENYMDITYCCRRDGFVDNGINLPIGKIKSGIFFSFLACFDFVDVWVGSFFLSFFLFLFLFFFLSFFLSWLPNKKDSCLKGLRHEDFAILGQLCAKIITKCLYSYTKCSCKAMGKISNEFYQGELTIIIFWWFLKT